MADTDQQPEGTEPEQQTPASKPVAKKKAAKKAAKKKVAKKKVAKKKVAKKKATKKMAAAKETAPEKEAQIVEATETPKAPPAAEPEIPEQTESELHAEVQQSLEKKSHGAQHHQPHDEEAEKKQLILMGWLVILVCGLLIGALSPESDKTEVKAPASVAQPQLSGPPARPEGSPPGYWRQEAGGWQFIPYESGEAQPAPQPEAESEAPVPAKMEQAASDMAPPELPADSPPGYWSYSSQPGEVAGNWVYVPYESAR